MKSSTPASAAIDVAVSGLSPVIIMDLIPICLNCSNLFLIPSLTISFNLITPNTCSLTATTNGVSPLTATFSILIFISAEINPPLLSTNFCMASADPFLILLEPSSIPLIPVSGAKGMNIESCGG